MRTMKQILRRATLLVARLTLLAISISSRNNRGASAFACGRATYRRRATTRVFSSNDNNNDDPWSAILGARLPTSAEDQVRQAVDSIQQANRDGMYRHQLRLLLPVIGATDLDDWPGGARQMMQAAYPLVQDIMKGLGARELSETVIDQSDGVYAILGQAISAKDDCCTILLPTADCVSSIRQWSDQVGFKRNLIIVNPQWKRRSDFGGLFGANEGDATYMETFRPTFSLTNYICEGEQVRILRNYPAPWRVYVRSSEPDDGTVDWTELALQVVRDQETAPVEWRQRSENKRDGGRMWDYGMPSYADISNMLNTSPNFTPKNPVQRAAAAFSFIKDSL